MPHPCLGYLRGGVPYNHRPRKWDCDRSNFVRCNNPPEHGLCLNLVIYNGDPPASQYFNNINAVFEKAHHVTITSVYYPLDTFLTNFEAAVAGHANINILMDPGRDIAFLQQQGDLVPVTGLIPTSSFRPSMLTPYVHDNKLWAYPVGNVDRPASSTTLPYSTSSISAPRRPSHRLSPLGKYSAPKATVLWTPRAAAPPSWPSGSCRLWSRLHTATRKVWWLPRCRPAHLPGQARHLRLP